MINPSQSTGEIEVLVSSFEILNRAKETLPFNIREFQKAKEALRMQYRYLDLRFSEMQKNMRIRSQFFMSLRTFLVNECQFVDVETPTLFKATPGVSCGQQRQFTILKHIFLGCSRIYCSN